MRSIRGWIYRKLPSWNDALFRKKLVGYERRWNLEREGFTKEGFFRILAGKILLKIRAGTFYELVAGDGLVGSLGGWLKQAAAGWQVEAWEHRPAVAESFVRNRPGARLHRCRLISWSEDEFRADLVGVTTRASREASGLCRAIRRNQIRPALVGIWNPSRRAVWAQRLARKGYRLCLVWHRMEFYLWEGS